MNHSVIHLNHVITDGNMIVPAVVIIMIDASVRRKKPVVVELASIVINMINVINLIKVNI